MKEEIMCENSENMSSQAAKYLKEIFNNLAKGRKYGEENRNEAENDSVMKAGSIIICENER
jgi:hypothetical protein